LESIRANSEDDLRDTLTSYYEIRCDIDWTKIAEKELSIAPYIYLKVKEYPGDFEIPEPMSEMIKWQYIQTVEKNEKIKKLIIALMKEFNEAQIELIPLKGAALLFTLYQDDIGIRPMSDIDILVKKDDLSEAENILRHIGYIEYYEGWKRKGARDHYARHHFHYIYFKNQILLELHWDIGHTSDISTLNILFDSYDKLVIEENELHILKPECNIFISCNNFCREYLEGISLAQFKDECETNIYRILFFLYETKKMLQYYGDKIGWDQFLLLLKSAKKEYKIITLLVLAKKIARADVPEIFLNKAKHNINVFMFILLCRRMRHDNVVGLLMVREIFLIHKRILPLIKNPRRLIKKLYNTWGDWRQV